MSKYVAIGTAPTCPGCGIRRTSRWQKIPTVTRSGYTGKITCAGCWMTYYVIEHADGVVHSTASADPMR